MTAINFFTVATNRYRIFILPYMISALVNNEDSCVEIITDRPKQLNRKYRRLLNSHFAGRWKIRNIPKVFSNWTHSSKPIKSIRWLAQPKIRAMGTYIGDIDILQFDKDILFGHQEHAKFIGRPYSNIVRPHKTKKKMSGLHCVITSEYYEKINTDYCKHIVAKFRSGKIPTSLLDECLLYRMVANRVGLPITKGKNKKPIKGKAPYYAIDFRPAHGPHLSYGRRLAGWGMSNIRLKQFEELSSADAWKDAASLFDKKFLQLVAKFKLSNALRNEELEKKKRISIV